MLQPGIQRARLTLTLPRTTSPPCLLPAHRFDSRWSSRAAPRDAACCSNAWGLAFAIEPADIDESVRPGEQPEPYARRLSAEKATATAERRLGETAIVVGADTIVVRDEAILGKPRDEAHAIELLSSLVGRRHEVITAVSIRSSAADCALGTRTIAISSHVEMRGASEDEIRRYVAGGEPMDKAGAYAAQGDGRRFVAKIEGSETNVIGLPVEETLELLYAFDTDASAAR